MAARRRRNRKENHDPESFARGKTASVLVSSVPLCGRSRSEFRLAPHLWVLLSALSAFPRRLSERRQLIPARLPKTPLAFRIGLSLLLDGLRWSTRSERQRKINRWCKDIPAFECQRRADERDRSQRRRAAVIEEGFI
jgi:hypothetical protein